MSTWRESLWHVVDSVPKGEREELIRELSRCLAKAAGKHREVTVASDIWDHFMTKLETAEEHEKEYIAWIVALLDCAIDPEVAEVPRRIDELHQMSLPYLTKRAVETIRAILESEVGDSDFGFESSDSEH